MNASWSLVIFSVLLYSSYTILIHLCEVDGRVPFSNAAVVLVIEISKAGTSCMLHKYCALSNKRTTSD